MKQWITFFSVTNSRCSNEHRLERQVAESEACPRLLEKSRVQVPHTGLAVYQYLGVHAVFCALSPRRRGRWPWSSALTPLARRLARVMLLPPCTSFFFETACLFFFLKRCVSSVRLWTSRREGCRASDTTHREGTKLRTGGRSGADRTGFRLRGAGAVRLVRCNRPMRDLRAHCIRPIGCMMLD